MTFPATEQVSLYFSMPCLLQAGQEAAKAESTGATGLLGMPGVKGAFIPPLPSPSPLAAGVYPALLGASVENHISPWSGRLPGGRWLQADVPMFSCERNFSFCQSAALYDEPSAPGSILELFNSLQVLGTSMCQCSRAENQEGWHSWGQQEGQRPKAWPAGSQCCREQGWGS